MPRSLAHAAAFSLALLLPAAALGQADSGMSLAERFQRLDRDRSGFVTWDEARPQREAEHGRLDRNGDGVLTPDEFEDRALPFAAFDADRDGRVTSAEYLAKHQEMFAGADTDGNGRISLEEFTRVQDAMRSAPR